jgi:hypothetical protein
MTVALNKYIPVIFIRSAPPSKLNKNELNGACYHIDLSKFVWLELVCLEQSSYFISSVISFEGDNAFCFCDP